MYVCKYAHVKRALFFGSREGNMCVLYICVGEHFLPTLLTSPKKPLKSLALLAFAPLSRPVSCPFSPPDR